MVGAHLADITVLELGSSLAGPYATRLLGDFGAEVIKVEAPGVGDPTRSWGLHRLDGVSPTFQALNNGKRSIVVDFADGDDVDALKGLIADRVDIIVQNLRPGVADKFGIGPGAALALNPRLIYCNISAFGGTGPMRRKPGYDPLIQAFSGIVDLTGPADGDPARVGVPIIDFGTGMWAAIGALVALHDRDRTGKGTIIDAAMLDAAMAWQTLSVATIAAGAPVPRRAGLRGPLIVPNAGYQTADGILIITIGTDRQFAKLCDAIGQPELAGDPRFLTNDDRHNNEVQLRIELEAAFGTRTRAHWSTVLNDADIPNAPIQTVQEVLAHDQTIASGIAKAAPDGGYAIIANALKFDGERPGFQALAPELGEGDTEILAPYRAPAKQT